MPAQSARRARSCRNAATGPAVPARAGAQDSRLRGTFLPFLRALESAIAIACLRLFTFPPLPPLPLLAFPRLSRCISRRNSSPEPFEYFLLRFLAILISL